MKFVADDGGLDSVVLNVRVDRSVRSSLDDLCFKLGWCRDRLVNEILRRTIPNIEVISMESNSPSGD